MSDKISSDDTFTRPARQQPLERPDDDDGRRMELRFGIDPVDVGRAALGPAPDGRWARPEDRHDDAVMRARLADERRRWAALPDGRRSQLRSLLTQLDRAIVGLHPSSDGAAVHQVEDAASALTAMLDLGPEPHVVACPICGRLGMSGATRCGFCWTALHPTA